MQDTERPAVPRSALTGPPPETGIQDQLAPWGAMAAVVLAASAARVAVYATGYDARVAGGVAVAGFVAAVALSVAGRRRIAARRMRHRFVAAVWFAALWLAHAAYAGIHLGAIAVLSIVGAGLSLLWWRERRIDATPAKGPVKVASEEVADTYATRWAKNLGGQGRQLVGSTLADQHQIKAGYRYTLDLVPGVQTVEQARGMVETLRGGLRLMPDQDVIVEVHPDKPAPSGLLTIVTRSPIKTPQVWPGPAAGFDPATGSVNLGPFADGEGIAQWSIYKRDGMFGGYLQGAPGSGKSRMIESIAMSAAASQSHPTTIWYGDGQHGDSSPMLVEHADYAATSNEAIYNMLMAAIGVMKINGVENRLAKRVGFHPTPERPGLLVILDECHKPLDAAQNPLLAAATQQACLTIAREGRKVGVGLIMASQSPTLDAFGGAGNGADTLRACLLAGNGAILRSKTRNAKTVFDVDINPSRFPELAGYAYLCNPAPDARSAPFRGYWVTDAQAASWPQRIRWNTLTPRQANTAGSHYARRHEVAAEQAMADALLLQLADAGMLDEMEALQAQVAATPQVDVIDVGGDMHPPIHRVRRFWLITGADSLRSRLAGTPLSAGQQKVLDAIGAGSTSPKDLIEVTGYSSSQVYNLLNELISLGHIVKTAYGQYQTCAEKAA